MVNDLDEHCELERDMGVIDTEMSSTANGVGEMARGGVECRGTGPRAKPHRAIQFQGQVEASKEA